MSNYQQIHSFQHNIQGIQQQKLQSQIQVLSPKSSYAQPPQYLIQSINHAGIQISQGYENSPSNRFLSNTAKVLKSQTIDFKQMMVKQNQQNLANHNYSNRQIIDIKKNQSEGIQIQAQHQHYASLQKPATPTGQANSQNQGFANTFQQFQRSNSASISMYPNGIQFDSSVQQPIFVKLMSSDAVQNSISDKNLKTNFIQSRNPSHFPQSPTQIKQKQKCMTYIIKQNNPQVVDIVERRKSVEEKADAQEIQKAMIRFSDSFRHKFSDSTQSNNTTSNPITTAVSVKSNYSPLQQFESIETSKNNQHNLINNSLQLEGNEQNNQVFVNDSQAVKNSFSSIQQTNNNEEIVAINDYQIGSSRISEEGSKTQRINDTPQDLNNITKIMNLYYFKNQGDVVENQNTSREQDIINSHQISQMSENKNSNDSRIKVQKDQPNSNNDRKYQVLLSQKSSPQSVSNNKGYQSQNVSLISNHQKNRKSLSGIYQSKSKNQISDDKQNSNPQSANKNTSKVNLQQKKTNNKAQTEYQKQGKTNSTQEKLLNSQKLLKQNSRSSSTQIINSAQSQKHYQLYDSNSTNKKLAQKTQQINDVNIEKQRKTSSQVQNQSNNHASQRQITFPESPISIANQIDSSCGFASEITYTEDQIQDNSNRVIMVKGNNPIPLVVNQNQIYQEISKRDQKNQQNTQYENNQHKEPQNQLINEKSFKKKDQQAQGSPQIQKQKNEYNQIYYEDTVFQNKKESKLLTEKKEGGELKNQVEYEEDDDDDDDCEANPDFINLYKTPAKPNNQSELQSQFTQVQNAKSNSNSAGQTQEIRLSIGQSEQFSSQNQDQSKLEKQLATEASVNNNNSAKQNQVEEEENVEDLKENDNQSQTNIEEQQDDKTKIESLKEFENNSRGEESPFILEMKKQHQKIIEGFSIKLNNGLDSKEDLNKFSKESSQSSSDAKYSYASKSDHKKQKRDIESVQSINELLNFMNGIPQSSNTDFIVPASCVSKQNLSSIFDENSNLPSNVCSLQMIQEQQMIEQARNNQNQQVQNKQMKDIRSTLKGATSAINQINSKHMTYIQTKLTAHQKNFIASQQKQQKKSQTTYKRNESPNQAVIQLKGNNNQAQGIKIQDLYVGQYSSKSLHQQKELQKSETTHNSQSLQQKQRNQERKSSLIKSDPSVINQQNKNQNVINLQKIAQQVSQLDKIVQPQGNNLIAFEKESKFNNSSTKETLKSSTNSQKTLKKIDNKSTNMTKNNSLTITQDPQNAQNGNQSNGSNFLNAQQTFLKKSTSNSQKLNNQNNYINFTNKSSDGGHIIMYQINQKKQ